MIIFFPHNLFVNENKLFKVLCVIIVDCILPVVIELVVLSFLSYKLVVRSRAWIWLVGEYKAHHMRYIVYCYIINYPQT